jgi:hypothetical protein
VGRARGRGGVGLGQHPDRRRLLGIGVGERRVGADAAEHDRRRAGQEKSSHDLVPRSVQAADLFGPGLFGLTEEMTPQVCAGAAVR